MKNKPNPELIDDENPEWTEEMLSAAKTAAELFPTIFVDHEAVLLSEQALAEDWLKAEEEAAWVYLQPESRKGGIITRTKQAVKQNKNG